MLGLLIIVVFILIIDVIPEFNIWQSRIHIGRWTDKELWKEKMSQKSLKWLKQTPTIKLTDNKRLIIIDILKGNYKRKSIQHWQEAGLLLGLIEVYKKNKQPNIQKQINNYIAAQIDVKGNWKNKIDSIDGVILAYAILKVTWVDHQKNKPAYDTIWRLILNYIGTDGTVEYTKHMKDYRFVDTIGFICPFLITYGIKFNNKEAIDLGMNQINEFNNYAMLQNEFIPCHTYNIKSKLPVGLFGWGRGLGWYAIGLIDAWKELPEDFIEKTALTKNVVLFAKTAMQFQKKDGSWNWLVTSKEALADSSTTATLAWFLANATKIEEISTECKASKDKALTYLMKVTRRTGAIDFSQGDTKGIGMYSQNFDILPFTQGFTLRTVNFDCL
tara:strand:+ start:3297 stop:4454 length:1158 start_codon:yes stop_codon:yes gene_type:complete